MNIPLSQLKEGQTATVVRMEGGAGMAQRLAGMGILPGSKITVLRAGGPAIVRTRENRVVIGRGMVDRVIVTPTPEQQP